MILKIFSSVIAFILLSYGLTFAQEFNEELDCKSDLTVVTSLKEKSNIVSLIGQQNGNYFMSSWKLNTDLAKTQHWLQRLTDKVEIHPCQDFPRLTGCAKCFCPEAALGIIEACPVETLYFFKGNEVIEFVKTNEKGKLVARKATLEKPRNNESAKADLPSYVRTDVDRFPYKISNNVFATNGNKTGNILTSFPISEDSMSSIYQITYQLENDEVSKTFLKFISNAPPEYLGTESVKKGTPHSKEGTFVTIKDTKNNLWAFGYRFDKKISIPLAYKFDFKTKTSSSISLFDEDGAIGEEFKSFLKSTSPFFGTIVVNSFWAGCRSDTSCLGLSIDAITEVDNTLLLFSGNELFSAKNGTIKEITCNTLFSQDAKVWNNIDSALTYKTNTGPEFILITKGLEFSFYKKNGSHFTDVTKSLEALLEFKPDKPMMASFGRFAKSFKKGQFIFYQGEGVSKEASISQYTADANLTTLTSDDVYMVSTIAPEYPDVLDAIFFQSGVVKMVLRHFVLAQPFDSLLESGKSRKWLLTSSLAEFGCSEQIGSNAFPSSKARANYVDIVPKFFSVSATKNDLQKA